VLRRIAEAARELRAQDVERRRGYLDLVARVIPKRPGNADAPGGAGESADAPGSRLILP
jgi:hypothetical protein